jgi:hypothetical protein
MEPAMFFVESGDHPKFNDPFPAIEQLLTLAAIHFMVYLALAALLHCTIVAPTKEISVRFLKKSL